MMNFWHVHSEYSKFDSTSNTKDIVKKTKELGINSVTLTDHGTLLGIESFMDAGKELGVNTVPGVEAYLENRTHLVIVAKNYEGYQSISYAMKEANKHIEKTGNITYPIMTDDILEKFFKGNKNVIASTACINGPIGKIILTNRRAERKLQKHKDAMKELFPSYEKYIELDKTFNENNATLSEDKKSRTALKKFTNKTHLNKIERLKKQLKETEPSSDKANRIKNQLYEAVKQKETAEAALKNLELKIKTEEKLKKSIKAQRDSFSKNRNKYLKEKQKVDEYAPIEQKELVDKAIERTLYLKSIFPNFYVEIQYHGMEDEYVGYKIADMIARKFDIPIIAANDAHMITKSDVESRRIMRFNYFIKSQSVEDADKELYLKTENEMLDAISQVIGEKRAKEAIENTSILDECKVVFPEEKHYPKIKTNEKFDDLLIKRRQEMIDDGLWDERYEKRLKHEVKIIKQMGYVDYHLVVRDFCNMGKKLGLVPKTKRHLIPEDFNLVDDFLKENNFEIGVGIGPGRGSAAGSLVCYMLDITNIDPIKYNLLFERYLNPARVSMPDIDTDVATSLRPKVIEYLKWRYGDNSVCSISTETTYGAKGAIQAAGRERAYQLYQNMGLKKADFDKKKSEYMSKYVYPMSDFIPEEPNAKLDDYIDEMRSKFKENEQVVVLEHAKLIEGKISGTGVHAGGIVISDNDNVNEYVPLAWNDEKKVWAAQCDMIKVEEKGLLKMDLLGLNTLDCINDCLYLVKEQKGVSIDINSIPFEEEVFRAIYSTGNTNSIFQFESKGMKDMLRKVKPTCFEDIILLVAAYRPGPMQYLDNIIAVKNGQKPLTYKTPELEEILSVTYGAVIYQEQVMMIFQKLAGYSLGDADNVRRFMSKKKLDKLSHEREAFINGDKSRNISGCIANGISETTANEIFDEMIDFAKYAFNKSHAAAYALVSYQTAWLKHHYPVEFQCSMFNNKEQDSFGPLIEDCEKSRIKLVPPSVNTSYYEFTCDNNSIYWGFRGIKGMGTANKSVMDFVTNERHNGFYDSFNSFLLRTVQKDEKKISVLQKKILEILVNSGCFDAINPNRKGLVELVSEKIESENTEDGYKIISEKINSLIEPAFKSNPDYNIEKEIELLGLILSEDPLKDYAADRCYGCEEIRCLIPQSDYQIMGYITEIKSIKDSYLVSIKTRTGVIEAWANGYIASSVAAAEKYKVFKFTVSTNRNNNVSIRRFTPLYSKINSYRVTVATKRDAEIFKKLYMKQSKQEGYNCIKLVSLIKKEGDQYKREDSFRVSSLMGITREMIQGIKNSGIPIEKIDTSSI